MKRKKQQLNPDIILKNYWRDNEHFADFFNAVLFAGEQVIQPDELENEDTESSYVSEHRAYMESIKAARDMICIHKRSTEQGVELVLLGMEMQEHIHYAMPMRVMGYDHSAYRKQYEVNARKYQGEHRLQGDEYLSRMRKEDRFIPVITVVVYYGEKPWDGAVSLSEMLNVPRQMKALVNDYKMRLVEARRNDLTLHNMNNIDLFNLLAILLDESKTLDETKERAIGYTQNHKVDQHVIMAVAGAAKCKIDYKELSKEGGTDMCRVFEENWSLGKAEGKAEGLAEGKAKGLAKGKAEGRAEGIIETAFDFGLSETEIITRLQTKLNIPQQKAREYFIKFAKHPV